MATKYTPEQSAKIIWKVSEENKINPCFMIAKANIESKLNNLAKNGSYVGLFQLSDGVGGCKGNDRLDPAKATKAAISYIRTNRAAVEPRLKEKGMVWYDWHAYLAHQQGAGGAAYILTNPNILIADSTKKKAIKSNSPKGFKGKTHKDFADYWAGVFESHQNKCMTDFASCVDSVETPVGMGDLAGTACKINLDSDAPSPYRQKEDLNTMLLIGGVALVAGGALAYFKIGKPKSKRKKGK